MTRIAIVALALAGITLAVPASGLAQRSSSAWGLGTARCERYLDAAQRGSQLVGFVDWLQGFLTAAEWLTAARVTDVQGAIAWLNEYCRQNAQAALSTAAMALTVNLVERARSPAPAGGR